MMSSLTICAVMPSLTICAVMPSLTICAVMPSLTICAVVSPLCAVVDVLHGLLLTFPRDVFCATNTAFEITLNVLGTDNKCDVHQLKMVPFMCDNYDSPPPPPPPIHCFINTDDVCTLFGWRILLLLVLSLLQ